MNNKEKKGEIEKWNKILEKEWLWLLKDEIDESSTDLSWEKAVNMCDWSCENCINTTIWENNTRINAILCCPYHPETKEVSEEWYCPEINLETWLCNIYKTTDYPSQCECYHCKTHWR